MSLDSVIFGPDSQPPKAPPLHEKKCYMPACGIDGKFCPECAQAPKSVPTDHPGELVQQGPRPAFDAKGVATLPACSHGYVDVAEVQKLLNEVIVERDEARKNYVGSNTSYHRVLAERDEARKAFENVRKDREQLLRELNKLTSDLGAARTEIVDFKAEIADHKRASADQAEEITALRQQLLDARNEVHRLNAVAGDTVAHDQETNRLTHQLAEMTKERDNARAALKLMGETQANHEAAIRAVHSRLSNVDCDAIGGAGHIVEWAKKRLKEVLPKPLDEALKWVEPDPKDEEIARLRQGLEQRNAHYQEACDKIRELEKQLKVEIQARDEATRDVFKHAMAMTDEQLAKLGWKKDEMTERLSSLWMQGKAGDGMKLLKEGLREALQKPDKTEVSNKGDFTACSDCKACNGSGMNTKGGQCAACKVRAKQFTEALSGYVAPDSGYVWTPCTPWLLQTGVDCAKTPRRAGKAGGHSHDHLVPVCGRPLKFSQPCDREKGHMGPCVGPVRTTSSGGFGRKDDGGKLRYDLIPPAAEKSIVGVLTYGAKKYAPENWRKVPDAISRYHAAARRHIATWQLGEKDDAETNLPHLAHAACCLMFLLELDGSQS